MIEQIPKNLLFHLFVMIAILMLFFLFALLLRNLINPIIVIRKSDNNKSMKVSSTSNEVIEKLMLKLKLKD